MGCKAAAQGGRGLGACASQRAARATLREAARLAAREVATGGCESRERGARAPRTLDKVLEFGFEHLQDSVLALQR